MKRRQSTADQDANDSIAAGRDLGQRPEVGIDKRTDAWCRRAEQRFLIAQHHREGDHLLPNAIEHLLLFRLGLVVALEEGAVAGREWTLRVDVDFRRVAGNEQS